MRRRRRAEAVRHSHQIRPQSRWAVKRSRKVGSNKDLGAIVILQHCGECQQSWNLFGKRSSIFIRRAKCMLHAGQIDKLTIFWSANRDIFYITQFLLATGKFINTRLVKRTAR